MHFLIDGYNLLHALGVMHARLGPGGLEKARLHLLGLLAGAYAPEEAADVTVIFDAARTIPGVPRELDYKGIHVHFAVRPQEADDLIETLIGHDSAPKQLGVVSDDHRIQQAARHRRCVVWPCENYLNWLSRHRRERRAPPPADGPDKPGRLSDAETVHWLEEFGDLEKDPKLKAFFEMDRFDFEEES